jgi:hypothetical protein
MIDPSEIVDNLVTAFQDIPELVSLLGGDPTRIYAFHDRWPEFHSMVLFIYKMKAGEVMVAWRETTWSGGMQPWKHALSVFVRPPEEQRDASAGMASLYGKIFRQLFWGTPTAGGLTVFYQTVHPDCLPMQPPSFHRNTLLAAHDEPFDYFEVRLTFAEIGDN